MRAEHCRKLCCPKCAGELRSVAFAEADGGGVRDGILLCERCQLRYPVINHVPVLLLFRTAVHDQFNRRYSGPLASWASYRSPDEEPLPGERTTQDTFTEEWDLIKVEDDELSFTYTHEDLVRLNREVWLKWLKRGPAEIAELLVVGCGAGKEAAALSELLPEARIFATDLNLSVIRIGEKLANHPRIHVTICSLFHLPFKRESFDLVYSQGVLHHNRSTREAFDAISPFVRPAGHLFIWVYGLDDHLLKKGVLGVISRFNYHLEAILRPGLSRAPKFLRETFFHVAGFVLHPLILTRIRHKGKWQMRHTIHGLRDWLSPRYAHLHGYNEVIEWFERGGFDVMDVQSTGAYRDLFNKQLWGVGMTGQKRLSAGGSAEPAPGTGKIP